MRHQSVFTENVCDMNAYKWDKWLAEKTAERAFAGNGGAVFNGELFRVLWNMRKLYGMKVLRVRGVSFKIAGDEMSVVARTRKGAARLCC